MVPVNPNSLSTRFDIVLSRNNFDFQKLTHHFLKVIKCSNWALETQKGLSPDMKGLNKLLSKLGRQGM